MNPMIAALQKSRSTAPAAPAPGGAPRPQMPEPAAPEAGPGDAMLQKLAGIESKLDIILKCMGAEQKEDASEETEGKEAAPNDHGY